MTDSADPVEPTTEAGKALHDTPWEPDDEHGGYGLSDLSHAHGYPTDHSWMGPAEAIAKHLDKARASAEKPAVLSDAVEALAAALHSASPNSHLQKRKCTDRHDIRARDILDELPEGWHLTRADQPAQTAEVERLRAALAEIVALPVVTPDHGHGGIYPPYLEAILVHKIARRALDEANRG
jgi:hypothetical protein